MSRFLHANATHLTKGFKASIHDESTAAIVVSQGLRNDSEVPVAGNVETQPSLDPHGPLVPSPDPAERETLSALSLEVHSPHLSETPLCTISSHPANCDFLFQSPGRYSCPRVRSRQYSCEKRSRSGCYYICGTVSQLSNAQHHIITLSTHNSSTTARNNLL